MTKSRVEIPQLPDDIIFEVLSRLPVKVLVRFSCACKLWRKLITSDRRFIQSQLQNSVKNLNGYENVLLSSGFGDSPQNFACHKYPDFQPVKLTESFTENSAGARLFFKDGKVRMAGCCDGVICFVQFSNYPYNLDLKFMVYLCNPALDQCRALPEGIYQGKCYSSQTLVSFFFDTVIDDYIVVKIINRYSVLLVEIYSLSTNSWKALKIPPCFRGGVPRPFERPVVHNGFPYWFACSQEDWNRSVLNVLDIGQEKIREIFFPNIFREPQLVVFQGSLSIFGRNFTGHNELWVIEDKLGFFSWKKKLEVRGTIYPFPLSNKTTGVTSYDGKLLISSALGTVFSYDPKDGKVEKQMVHLDGRSREYVVADYVASLVSVLSPTVDKEFRVQNIQNQKFRV